MSQIRPPAQSPLFPVQTPPWPARGARSDFFRAALDGVQAPTAAVARERTDTPVATAAAPTFAASPERATRPGSLLDIRI